MSKDRLKNVTAGLKIKPSEASKPRMKNIERQSEFDVKIPGKVTRWVIVDDARKPERFNNMENKFGYVTVSPAEAGRIDDGSGLLTMPAGDGRTYVCMSTPVEEYEIGLKEKRAKTDAAKTEMFRDHVPGSTSSLTDTFE